MTIKKRVIDGSVFWGNKMALKIMTLKVTNKKEEERTKETKKRTTTDEKGDIRQNTLESHNEVGIMR